MLYAPHKVFKKVIQNPKYAGVIIVFVLFVATQTAFYFSYYSKVYSEQTYPAGDQFGTLTQNSTLWTTSSDAVISRNYDDLINSTLYGNSSLQVMLANTSSLFMELDALGGSVNCGPTGFQNISMRIKLIEPQSAPEKATLYLYSLSASNYFEYDLTQDLSTTNIWNNLTIPVGSGNWVSNGNPDWQNITGLKLDLAYSTNSSVTLLMEGIFFRGIYETPLEVDSTIFLVTILQLVFTQFLFEWLILSGLMFVLIKVLKGTTTWKPLAVAVGFALITLIIQTLVVTAATTTLPSIYYPLEFLASVPGEAQTIASTVAAGTETFSLFFAGFQIVTYIWIVALGALITRNITAPVGAGEDTPEGQQFSWMKCFLVSGPSMLLTIIILGFLIGV